MPVSTVGFGVNLFNKMKKSFIIYLDSLSVLDELTNEQAGELFKAIRDIQEGKEGKYDLWLKMALAPFKRYFTVDADKWEEIREKRSAAGKASANKRQQVLTSVDKSQQKSTVTVNVNDNVTVNDTVNDNVNVTVKKQEKKKPLSKDKGDTYGDPVINELMDYLKDKTGTLDGSRAENRKFCNLLLKKMAKDFPKHEVCVSIKHLIEAGLRDDWHSKNISGFKYLYYNTGKIIQSFKNGKSFKKQFDHEGIRQRVADILGED